MILEAGPPLVEPAALADTLVAALQETLGHTTQLSGLVMYRNHEIINVYSVKPFSSGVMCYTAMDS